MAELVRRNLTPVYFACVTTYSNFGSSENANTRTVRDASQEATSEEVDVADAINNRFNVVYHLL